MKDGNLKRKQDDDNHERNVKFKADITEPSQTSSKSDLPKMPSSIKTKSTTKGKSKSTTVAGTTTSRAIAKAKSISTNKENKATTATVNGTEQTLEVGSKLYLLFRDVESDTDSPRQAQIVERRDIRNNPEFYVHYVDYNRRLDEWLTYKQILERRVLNVPSSQSRPNVPVAVSRTTRHQKRRHDEMNHVQKSFEEMDPQTAALEKEHELLTKVKYINSIIFGSHEIECWYFAPYPEPFGKASKLFLCEYCFKYFKYSKTLDIHKAKCDFRQPPGREIYRKEKLSIFEVDGGKATLYCQNLCLLAKFFLDHKTLFFDVDLFLFYVLCECDEDGAHIVGYFSKEKKSLDNYNLACILTLPPYQRKGFGKLLIAFSYELSNIEGKLGSPEKPLSDLGALSYRSYWASILLRKLRILKVPPTVDHLSDLTGFTAEDIITTLQSLSLIKFWKGQYIIVFTLKILDEYIGQKAHQLCSLTVDPDYIKWQGPPPLEFKPPANT